MDLGVNHENVVGIDLGSEQPRNHCKQYGQTADYCQGRGREVRQSILQ